jgi:hypothetical protein
MGHFVSHQATHAERRHDGHLFYSAATVTTSYRPGKKTKLTPNFSHRARGGPSKILVSRKLGDQLIGHLLVHTSKVVPHILLW